MTAKITGENKKIIKIGYYKMIPVILQSLPHESLKYSWRIREDKRYTYTFIKTPWIGEGCEMTTFRTKMDLMVCLSLVSYTKVLASS